MTLKSDLKKAIGYVQEWEIADKKDKHPHDRVAVIEVKELKKICKENKKNYEDGHLRYTELQDLINTLSELEQEGEK
jgi:O-succinylbenzoate synthase